MGTLFERLDRGRPTPAESQLKPEPDPEAQKLVAAQKLLDWLQHDLTRSTIRAREIRNFGPRPRNKENAIRSAEILVKKGWLIPLKPARHDTLVWQIVRRPIIQPTVATE
jgi:hypothetical protein